MMLEKPKPDETTESSSATTPPSLLPENDREKDLERRLAMLGHSSGTSNDNSNHNQDKAASSDLLSFDGLTVHNSTTATSAPLPASAPTTTNTVKPNKNALLAKIMAAQERAKQAKMKQASSTTTPAVAAPEVAAPMSAPIEQKNFTMLPEPTQMTMNAQKLNTFDALNGLVDNAMGKDSSTLSMTTTTTSTLPPPSQLKPGVPPMANVAPVAVPFVAPAMAPSMPPPSFEIFEQQQKKEEEKAAAFDNELSMLGMEAPTATPSAPTAPIAPPTTTNATEESLLDAFGGVQPMAPPQQQQPQQTTETQMNEEEAELLDDDNMFEYDMDGNKLSPEERRKLMEEQRAIMEQIQKQAVENKASEAAVRANAFETRMTETALTQNIGGGGGPSNTTPAATAGRIDLSSQDVDLSCVDAAQVEEQRAILEEIERQKAAAAAAAVAPTTTFNNNAGAMNTGGVAIDGGYQSPDFAIPKTRQHNPNIAESVREAMQMEEDRKLAEALQQEENQNAAAAAASNRSAAAESQEESTWWDTIVGSMGGITTTGTEETQGNQRSAEINISRPPGSMSPSQRALHGSPNNYERQGLLGTSNAGSGVTGIGNTGPQAARVAESKPLFSCVVDSVANAATAAAAGATSMVYGEDEEVNGVDTTSFLSVSKTDDRSGDYSAM